jgi:hypothetical protein
MPAERRFRKLVAHEFLGEVAAGIRCKNGERHAEPVRDTGRAAA